MAISYMLSMTLGITSIIGIFLLTLQLIFTAKQKKEDIKFHNKEVERISKLKEEGKKRLAVAEVLIINYLNDDPITIKIDEEYPYELINNINEQTYKVIHAGKTHRVELEGNRISSFIELPKT